MIIFPHPLAELPDKSEFRLLCAVNGMNRKMKRGIVILLAVAMMSCGNKKGAAGSDGVLNQQEMVKVLTEVYVAEEKVNRLSLSRDSAEEVFTILQSKIFEKTGVPDSVFKKSVNYYLEHPVELEQIYTVLVDSLNLQEQRANVKRANTPPVE